ncbi:riboflavin synthase alpha chain [Halobacillus karajensis]|uniref:Riboflavin synthase n=1 Tax=Halobacillus karajensis TaxID=195088 RepID=A0A024P4G5_9BACI|nr:riboflavin synthase [Halobacillus karajensis]CDQ18757.1 Riboflavin synthase [Halobacillus karajensis]CDQ23171.1 Riboflavin synthase [Halobacillus karajensis]CDQ26653.1 Riboflavin synthase [Halobacillus karajensis]SEH46651.1 riboflavin synthase alpha chain [Halobacillus karajensis]
MFTGIVEEIGTLKSVKNKTEALEVKVAASDILTDVNLGDSISVNGVCLTVTSYTDQAVSFDVMPETYRATNIHELQQGDPVNLERAMAAGGRFGGHLVSGHIDGTGKIVSKNPESNAVYYEIELSEELIQYFVYKGSIAVDGTSLTVFGVQESKVTISLIPHTMEHTVLGGKGPGDTVNIECDMIGKYVAHFLSGQNKEEPKSKLSKQFLSDNGFA